MKTITSAQAQTIVTEALKYARAQNFKPLGVAVLDVRGALMAYVAEDGSSLGRAYVAMGKASGAISMGMDGLNNAVIPGYATPEQYTKEITIANDGIDRVSKLILSPAASGSSPSSDSTSKD